MLLIVGLGNPGKEYENTRHNIGFMILDQFAKKNNVNIDSKKFNGLYTEVLVNNKKVILLKPQSFMNLSGEVVKKFVDYFKIDIDDVLVINDDLDIEIGKYKLKKSGSSGGHNGLKNIENHLQTNNYKRLKVGISKEKNIDTKDYVLGKFNKQELEILNSVIQTSENILTDYFEMTFDNLMNKYNHK